MLFFNALVVSLVWFLPQWLPIIENLAGLKVHAFGSSEAKLIKFWAIVYGAVGFLVPVVNIVIIFSSRKKK